VPLDRGQLELHGTTCSISAKNFSRRVCFVFAVYAKESTVVWFIA
jgi:hypothetical protein